MIKKSILYSIYSKSLKEDITTTLTTTHSLLLFPVTSKISIAFKRSVKATEEFKIVLVRLDRQLINFLRNLAILPTSFNSFLNRMPKLLYNLLISKSTHSNNKTIDQSVLANGLANLIQGWLILYIGHRWT